MLDSVGIGEMPDAAAYGDAGSDTLGNIARQRKLHLAESGATRLGQSQSAADMWIRWSIPRRHSDAARSRRPAKTPPPATGRWWAFIWRSRFRCFRTDFRPKSWRNSSARIGRGTLGNYAASGTEIIKKLGEEHMRTGKPIVYTSADSVFQVAAHEEVIPLWELYKICETAREILRGPYEVGRVIARPFHRQAGLVHAHAQSPRLRGAAAPRHAARSTGSAGCARCSASARSSTCFSDAASGDHEKTKNNADGMAKTLDALDELERGLIFVNLVDFDQLYGHRNDVEGYAKALEEFDAWLPSLYAQVIRRAIC